MAKCPICNTTINIKSNMLKHFEVKHHNRVPDGMSVAQYIYAYNHNGRITGVCRYCGGPTPWNEKSGKPRQTCTSPICAAKNKRIAQDRMLSIYGKESLMDDPKHLEKMLANRRISGTYNWSDGKHKFTYTGMYEKFTIEWLDKVVDIDPECIQMPGPVLTYDLDGQPAYWITDMYLPDFNLIVEIKDGNENPNPNYSGTRHREEMKDEFMRHQNEFNYVKVTHKNVMQLIKIMSEIKNKNIIEENGPEKNKEVIIEINT